jgi:EmrB/QacA subfamily drug resistance transporter
MSIASRLPCDEASIRGGAHGGDCSAARKRWVLAASILGSSLAFIDGTVVNVALPAIQRSLAASAYQAQWVVESYALLLAALLLLGGALSDRLGRRRVFIAGVLLFAAGSAACARAASVGQLIAARALQGAGAALLVPGSMALISAHFPESERGRAFGLWTGISGITSAVGPLVGGWLVDQVSWRWAFAVNLPVAAAVVAIAWWRVPESAPVGARRLDLGGAAFATLALGGAAYAFTEAPTRGWTAPAVLAALALAAVAVPAFVAVERRHPAPMVPLGLLRNRTFAGANALTLLLYAGLGGGLYFLPLNLVQVQGYSATAAGAALLPFILILFVLSRWAGSLVERHGARGPLVVGPLIAAAGFALLALPGSAATYWTGFLPGVAVLGLGMAITIAPLTTTVMNAVDVPSAGVASGVNNAVSRVAGLLAVAVFGWVMGGVFGPALLQGLRDAALAPAVLDAAWAQRDRLAALRLEGVEPATQQAVQAAVQHAFVAGFRWIMAASATLAVLGAVIAASTVARRLPATAR